ncbi:MAG: hypothetical protein LBV69_11655 [Bacteroidales bacterium]|jgi:lambda repressor-like predicted transcriptional regulator|nr:hypothetical protein [Bacteroidales bacterium]
MVLDEFHIGNIIKAKLDEQGKTIPWLAKELNIDESALRKNLNCKYLHSERIAKISFILKYDFFKEFPDYSTDC